MNEQQQAAIRQLRRMKYRPIAYNSRTDDSVHVSIVRKLGTGVMRLTVGSDGRWTRLDTHTTQDKNRS